MDQKALMYFSRHSIFTDPAPFTEIVRGLPTDIDELRNIVRETLVHRNTAEGQPGGINDERLDEVNIRYASGFLERARQLDLSGMIFYERQVREMVIGTSRDFSLLLCSLLRTKGIPSRLRCGFANYFRSEPKYSDHWVCEYWDNKSCTWKLADPYLGYSPGIDPLDVPRENFWVAGQAWQRCRNGGANPEEFGFDVLRGYWFIGNNLVRDIASLNKVEMLPRDFWGCMNDDIGETSISWEQLMAKISKYSVDPDTNPSERILEYLQNDNLRVPNLVTCITDDGERLIGLPLRYSHLTES